MGLCGRFRILFLLRHKEKMMMKQVVKNAIADKCVVFSLVVLLLVGFVFVTNHQVAADPDPDCPEE